MKPINPSQDHTGVLGASLPTGSTAVEAHLLALEDRLRELAENAGESERARLVVEVGRALVQIGRNEEAWQKARPAFDVLCDSGNWENAAEACDVLFLADQPGSLSALGQGIWLAVTFPMDPEITVRLLGRVVEDTPDDSDGAAVAAAAAVYVTDLRAQGEQAQQLRFFANQMLGAVARRHSGVDSAENFDLWIKRLELDDPQSFLPRLRSVVEVLVQDDWWIERDQIQAKLPVT